MSDMRRGEGRGADTALLPAVRSEDPGDPPTWTEATRFGALAPLVPAADDEDRAPEGAADWGATGNGNGGGPGHDGGSGPAGPVDSPLPPRDPRAGRCPGGEPSA